MVSFEPFSGMGRVANRSPTRDGATNNNMPSMKDGVYVDAPFGNG